MVTLSLNDDSARADGGSGRPRCGSTVPVHGTGHLVRKGTGGRSSVR